MWPTFPLKSLQSEDASLQKSIRGAFLCSPVHLDTKQQLLTQQEGGGPGGRAGVRWIWDLVFEVQMHGCLSHFRSPDRRRKLHSSRVGSSHLCCTLEHLSHCLSLHCLTSLDATRSSLCYLGDNREPLCICCSVIQCSENYIKIILIRSSAVNYSWYYLGLCSPSGIIENILN